MLLHTIYELLKAAGITVLIGFVVVAYLLLAGCASVEGAGFENSGRNAMPVVCHQVRRGYTQCYTTKQ